MPGILWSTLLHQVSRSSAIPLVGHKMFLRLVLVDLVDHCANSLWLQHAAILGLSFPCGIVPPSSSCLPLSQCTPQAVCWWERLPVTVFDKIAILSSERSSNCTRIQYFYRVSKYFCVEWSLDCSSRMESPPYFDRRPSGSQWKTQIAYPFRDFFLLGSIHFWLLDICHLHFRRDRCTRWRPLATVHCLAMQDQWDYLLNVPGLLWNTGSAGKS